MSDSNDLRETLDDLRETTEQLTERLGLLVERLERVGALQPPTESDSLSGPDDSIRLIEELTSVTRQILAELNSPAVRIRFE